MNVINAIADFVAMPDPKRTTWKMAIFRAILFILIAVLALEVGYWIELPLTIGWMLGYIWGALTVYGSMRPYLRT